MFEASEEGTPQGGPLSPLLTNIMLNELDKELERRGLPFVRYADDSMIFCKSKRAALRVKESITRFIEGKLYLRVNREKTVVSYVKGVKYLGYSFYVMKGKTKTKVANLIKCGINKYQAYEWGNTRKSYWRTADSPILHRAISNDNLRKAGYATLMGEYLEWHPK